APIGFNVTKTTCVINEGVTLPVQASLSLAQPRSMVGLLLGLCLFLSASICTGATLKKVIVVARHGNRAPNAPVPYLCPNMKPQLEEFREPIFSKYGAALSRVGLAENWESG
ncbi:hypothetical protein FOZ63_017355, partial [Perkinsus olseni]